MAAGAPDIAITGIDHGVVGVRDLEAARARYAAMGFTLTPRGRHIGWATANYCIMFPDGYIELLGVVEPEGDCAGLDRNLAEQGEGLLKLALRSRDAARTHGILSRRGLVTQPVKDLARTLEAPEGTVMPAFRLIHPTPDATPGLAAFICQHLNPAQVWRDDWCAHANTATGVESYSVLAQDPAALAPGWARLLGAGAVSTGPAGLSVATGTARLDFMTPEAIGLGFKGVEFAEPAAGRTVAVTLRVDALAAVAGCLAAATVACIRTDDGLVVPPDESCGVAIKFSERV